MAIRSAPMQTAALQNGIPTKPGYQLTKRLLDIVFSLCILLPLVAIIAILAVMICLDSKGPIFFRQKRLGKDGVEFEMLKLRSMYAGSNDAVHRQAIKLYMNGEKLSNDSEAPYKVTNDPRVTRVGNIIRKTSLDELPQFWNVLRGEMTLVGPRPALPYEVENYTSREWRRLSGKPGLTGPWQVYGRSKVTFQEMMNMDIAYLQRQSLWEDLKLIVLTIPVMLLKRGAV